MTWLRASSSSFRCNGCGYLHPKNFCLACHLFMIYRSEVVWSLETVCPASSTATKVSFSTQLARPRLTCSPWILEQTNLQIVAGGRLALYATVTYFHTHQVYRECSYNWGLGQFNVYQRSGVAHTASSLLPYMTSTRISVSSNIQVSSLVSGMAACSFFSHCSLRAKPIPTKLRSWNPNWLWVFRLVQIFLHCLEAKISAER